MIDPSRHGKFLPMAMHLSFGQVWCRRERNLAGRRQSFIETLGKEEMAEQKWPDVSWIERHGQSAGNVARDNAVFLADGL
jgi:hypothetical protein